jgi:hypothetical protein
MGSINSGIIKDIEYLMDSVGYGRLEVSIDLHNKKGVRLVVSGKKRTKYKDNKEAINDILVKIGELVAEKKDTKLLLQLNFKSGNIDEIYIFSEYLKGYN